MSKRAIVFVLGAAVVLWLASPLAAPTIPRPQLKAEPSSYSGPCPATVTFTAEIIPPPLPGPVRYRFVRSDGAESPVQEIRMMRPRRETVSYTWTLGADYSGWVQLKILFPARVESNRAHFRVRCIAADAGGAQEAAAGSAGEPKRFFLDFVDAYLVYVPSSQSLQITTEGMVLSYGDGWEKCQLKPYLYHLRRSDWQDFFWQVNTSRKEIIRIRGGQFCTITEGSRQKLVTAVEVVGGRGDTTPDRFLLRFKKSYLVHEPSSDVFQVIGEGTVLSRGENWERCQLKPYLYHLRLSTWREFFWKVNTSRSRCCVLSLRK